MLAVCTYHSDSIIASKSLSYLVSYIVNLLQKCPGLVIDQLLRAARLMIQAHPPQTLNILVSLYIGWWRDYNGLILSVHYLDVQLINFV